MSLTLHQLRALATVARTGSVRGAAQDLVVSQPSVSAAIGALEEELGADLFERRGRRIELSAAGLAVVPLAQEILALERAVRDTARVAVSPGTGHLSIVAVTTAAEYVLPAPLRRFRRRHPAVELALEVGNRSLVVDRLSAHEADLGIAGRPPTGTTLAGERFARNDLIVVGAPGSPLASARTVSPEALVAQTWLMRERGSGTRAATEQFLGDTGIVPHAVLTLGSNGAVKQGAALGLGFALLPEAAVADELRSRRVVRIRVRGTPVRRAWYVLWRTGGHLRPAAKAFRDGLLPARPSASG